MKKIYFDYAATTPIDEKVAEKLTPLLKEPFGNPSSLHCFGQESLIVIDKAREAVANFLNAKRSEVFFVSSATQANNIAILGTLKNKKNPHVITTAFEHKAVLEPLKESGAQITYLPVYKEGVVKTEDVLGAVKEETALISIGYVNSEIGTVQPIEEIGKIIREKNSERKEKIVFHTDAVQAVNYFNCNVQKLGVDILSLSGHKIYGPKGVGALYIKEGTPVSPIFFGASQEKSIFPGTENIFAIAGLGFAVERIKENDFERTKKLQDKIIDNLLEKIPNTKLNGDRQRRSPNNVNISFQGAEGESLLVALDMEGVAVSTGSACASKSLEPSYVLLALGLSHEEAHNSLRISLGRTTTEKEVDYLLEKLPVIVEKLRKISGSC